MQSTRKPAHPAFSPRKFARLLIVWTALQLAHAATLCAAPSESPPVNVLIICIDALRADHVGAYGYGAGTTPELDRLARSGVVFENAFSATSWTKPSVPSYMTGRFPHQHGVYLGVRSQDGREVADVLAESETTLAEMFRASGFRTAAVVANPTVSKAMGIGQGFESYVELEDQSARSVREHFFTWLGNRSGASPFFAYLHFNDVHLPYDPPARYLPQKAAHTSLDFSAASWRLLKRRIREGSVHPSAQDREAMTQLYDGEIRSADAEIGLTLAELGRRSLLDDTLVVVLADHGEELLERGGIDHGTSLYDELVRVPLIFRFPAGAHGGARIGKQVSLVDVLPTLAERFSLPLPDHVSGHSLLAAMEKATQPAARVVYSEGIHPAGYQQALRMGPWKYIVTVASTDKGGAESEPKLPESNKLDGLVTGVRVEVTGTPGQTNEFVADKLEIRPRETSERAEISGKIEAADAAAHTLTILGYHATLAADCTIKAPGGTQADFAALQAGTFIKLHGHARSSSKLAVTRVEMRDPSLPKTSEIEGRVTGAIHRISDREVDFELAHRTIHVTAKTRVAVADEHAPPAPRSATQAAGPTIANDPWQRALARGAAQKEELYDLANDAGERHDVAAKQPQKLAEMRSMLAALRQTSASEAAPTRVLEQRDIEAMRSLGYVE